MLTRSISEANQNPGSQALSRRGGRRAGPCPGRVMDDKHATTGILVTTSWMTKDGHDFAQRHGRIRLIECEEIKYLCKEHLDLDVLISLPKPPPKRR